MAVARFPSFVIDCPDPGALATFYGAIHPIKEQTRWHSRDGEGYFEAVAAWMMTV
jgi:hypothetical protein